MTRWTEDPATIAAVRNMKYNGNTAKEIAEWLAGRGYPKRAASTVRRELGEIGLSSRDIRDPGDVSPTARLIDELKIALKNSPRWIEPVHDEQHSWPMGIGESRAISFCIGDVHTGQESAIEEVGREHAYGHGDLVEQFTTWTAGVLALLEEQSTLGPIELIELWGLGDFVENLQKRPSARLTVDIKSTARQTSIVTRMLIGVIRRIRANYPLVKIVVRMLAGNHDYVDKPGDSLHGDNWAYMIGEVLDMVFQDTDLVEVKNYTVPAAIVQLAGVTVFLRHGNGAKGDRSSIEHQVAKWVKWHGIEPQLVVLGHFHNATEWVSRDGYKIVINGVFPDTGQFGQQIGSRGTPVQKAFVFTRSAGLIYTRDIRLTTGRLRKSLPEMAWS